MTSTSARATPRRSRAVLALLCVTVLWGWTFVWMKQALDTTRAVLGPEGVACGIGLFMTLRFGLAALAMLALPAVRADLTPGAWRGGLWIGLALLGGFLLQMFGLTGVSPAVSAFLTSLYVLFTALLNALRERKPPHAALMLGALLATFGAGFIGGPPPQVTRWFGAGSSSDAAGFGRAEWLTIGCAFVFAVHILVTDAWTKREKPLPVTFTQFVVVAIGGALTLALARWNTSLAPGATLWALLAERGFWLPLLLSSSLATVLALSLMNLFQRDLDPVRAAIVYAIEPVWASLVGIALGYEHPTHWLWVGGSALLAGNLIAELVPLWMQRRGAR
ncbi:MAG: DMT family transporter [Planctomycetes bacterium]|nr:DMT family transporter [Planctomycetota bacterium]